MFNVLIVDDSELTLAVVKALCESIGLTCTTVSEPNEACELIESNPSAFDIVLLDNYFSPSWLGADGNTPSVSVVAEGLFKIRELFPGFLVGSSGDAAVRDGFVAEGADYFLHKPITADSIREMCDAAKLHLG